MQPQRLVAGSRAGPHTATPSRLVGPCLRPPTGCRIPALVAVASASCAGVSSKPLPPDPLPPTVKALLPFTLQACSLAGCHALATGALHGTPLLCLLALPPLLFFGVAPAVDLLLGERSPAPDTPAAQPRTWQDGATEQQRSRLGREMGVLRSGLQPALVVCAYWVAAVVAWGAAGTAAAMGPVTFVALAASLGTATSSPNAFSHELVHSRSAVLRALASLHLAGIWHGPYDRAHHHHHKYVATPHDWIFNPKGTSLYAFAPLYMRAQWAGAVSLDREEQQERRARQRLERARAARAAHGSSAASSGKQSASDLSRDASSDEQLDVLERLMPFMHSAACLARQLGMCAAAFFVGGRAALALHLAVAAVAEGLFIIEEYCQHYGLQRRQLPGGRYEPVGPRVAWNSSYPIENALLANVSYHSDHHTAASKLYPALTVLPDAPRLPLPVALWGLAALFPPLWRALMDPLVDRANSTEPWEPSTAVAPLVVSNEHAWQQQVLAGGDRAPAAA